MDINYELLQTRIVAFLYELGVTIALSLLAYFSSEDFSALVQSHFGESAGAAILLLVVSGAVKHIRNLNVLKKADDLGGRGGSKVLFI